ncbi:MAG: hypothetical protein JXA90_10530 [Planctomycetes bacterium]|nr:hypothetical protein [Planctomycetota bacterium]
MDDARTTVRLDRGVHRRLKILAAERETTFGALLDEALRQYLDAEERRRSRRGRRSTT